MWNFWAQAIIGSHVFSAFSDFHECWVFCFYDGCPRTVEWQCAHAIMLESRRATNKFQVVVSAEILLKHATVDLGDMLLQIGPHDAALENGD